MCIFFFSSRRRHTRWPRDWSSDVCSSDLTLGKKKTKDAQNLLDSLIPFGMMIGFAVAVLLSIFLQISLLSTIAWGPGIGLLFGYFAYEIYSKKEESY